MPRILRNDLSPNYYKAEIVFTEASIGADPDAKEFEAIVSAWWTDFRLFRDELDALDLLQAKLDAREALTRERLASIISIFGKTLYAEENEDRSSIRWQRFFGNQILSAITRLPLSSLLEASRPWLKHDQDPLLLRHLPKLSLWIDLALTLKNDQLQQSDLSSKRKSIRDTYVKNLNDQREALDSKLKERARSLSLGSSWSKAFFKRG